MMDQHPALPPDFTLPGFANLMGLMMAAQQMDYDEAITFFKQHWKQTGLGGVHPNWDDDPNLERGKDPQQQQPNQDHEGDVCRGNQGQAGQSADPAQPVGLQSIMFDPDTHITTTLIARPADYAIKHIASTYCSGTFPGKDCVKLLGWSGSQMKITLSQSPKLKNGKWLGAQSVLLQCPKIWSSIISSHIASSCMTRTKMR